MVSMKLLSVLIASAALAALVVGDAAPPEGKTVEAVVEKVVTKGKNMLGSAKAFFGFGRKACPKKPLKIPAKSTIECSTIQCQAKCEDRYRFPNGNDRLLLACDDTKGQWFVQDENEWPEIPDCLPVCKPPCRNKGICIGPGVCRCPPNFTGQFCEREVKKCSRNPDAPANAAVVCGPEDCTVKCDVGYAFPKSIAPSLNSTSKTASPAGRQFREIKLQCKGGNVWGPVNGSDLSISTIPDCERVCQPECRNGGVCLADNKCECARDFRGNRCEFPISTCDISKTGFGGLHNCTHGPSHYQCTLSCPDGFVFDSNSELQSGEFRCDYSAGQFEGTLPTCVPAPTPEPPTPKPGKCQLWGGRNYLTYDGSLFSFEGECNYRILQSTVGSNTLSIDVETSSECESNSVQASLSSNCFKAVLINLNYATYKLYFDDRGNPVFENPFGVEEPIPIRLPGGESLEIVADTNVVFAAPELDVVFIWKSKGAGSIEVGTSMWNQTAGLCGTLDGYPEEVSAGAAGLDLGAYVGDWQIEQPTSSGSSGAVSGQCSEPIPVEVCSKLGDGDVLANEGAKFCQLLLTDATFAGCHELVDPMPFVGVCMEDYCSCGASTTNKSLCGCSTMEVYVDACKYAGGPVGERWRKEICPMNCGRDFEYNSCVTSSPRTCEAVDEIDDDHRKVCVEGCACPGDKVLMKPTGPPEEMSFGISLRTAAASRPEQQHPRCVKPDACPCTHHGERFDSGATMEWDCNTCQCNAGTWTCTHQPCGSRCAVFGDPHYSTFDKKIYDFMGKCSYYLIKGEGFSIQGENVACSGTISPDSNFPTNIASQMPSCAKSATIVVNGTAVQLLRNHEVLIDGYMLKEKYPAIKPFGVVNKVSDSFIVVELKNGFEVWWDGFSQLYIDAPASARDTFSGMCGTFNDNPNDDFLTPEGDLETVPNDFGNRWKVDATCPDQRPLDHPCPAGTPARKTAENHCSVILDSVFADCQRDVDPRPYFENCVYDTCSCTSIGRDIKECLCPAISSYGNECSRKGFHIDWRGKQRLCGMHCQAPRTYQVCANKCETSCAAISLLPDCREKCVEGCNCPPGMVEDDNGECVPVSECPCYHKGRTFKPGSKELRPGEYGLEICECHYGKWKCATARSDELTAMSTTVAPVIACNRSQVFTPCEPAEKLSCKNMHYMETSTPAECFPGCECKRGLVLNDVTGECIEPSQCPCHHARRSYRQGAVINQDCNTCTCEGGRWTCTNIVCSGICSVWGPSHYKTFDGKVYDFDGSCSYMLAKGKLSSKEMFEVVLQNEGCVAPHPSGSICSKHVTIKVSIDDEKEVYELEKHDSDDTKNVHLIEVFSSGLFRVAVIPRLRLVVYWDKGTRIYLEAEPVWKGKLKGLCGDFNGNAEDDFKTPSGGSPEKLPEIFGDSWRTQYRCPVTEPTVRDACKISSKRLWARQKCSILKSTAFRSCRSEIPVDPFVERCEQDTCSCDSGGDCECLCTAIAAYAQECARIGVPVKWRSQELCPLQCDATCAEYSACVSPCPLKTCSNHLDYGQIRKDLCFGMMCLEGCKPKECAANEVYTSSWKCLDRDSCLEPPCLTSANGTIYHEGDEIERDPCHVCHCSQGQRICRGQPCKKSPPSTLPPLPVFTTTPAPRPEPPAPIQTASCLSGWTDWINNDHPVPFKKAHDEEPFDIDWRKVHRYPATPICPADKVTQIECRTVGTHWHPKSTGQNVECSLERGLVCKGLDVDHGRCFDYEIRLLCECGHDVISSTPTATTTTTTTTTAAPSPTPPAFPPISCENGWTSWMNGHVPDASGEFELVDDLRQKFSFCPNHALLAVECKSVTAAPGDNITVADGICDRKSGYRCIASSPAAAGAKGPIQNNCADHEIRVRCECGCLGPLGMENQLIPGTSISVSSSLAPDTGGSSARLNGASAWVPATSTALEEWLKIDLGGRKRITGLLVQSHPTEPWWISTFFAEVSNDSVSWIPVKAANPSFHAMETQLTSAKKISQVLFPEAQVARYVSIVPIVFIGKMALRLEVLGCAVVDLQLFPAIFVPTTTEPTVFLLPETSTSPAPTTTLGPPLPPAECVTTGWTQWMSSHSPAAINQDEAETFRRLRTRYSFCRDEFIGAIQCRPKDRTKQMQLGITCDLNSGLYCNSYLQGNEGCFDYEVMVRCDCWKGQLTTTTGAPVIPPTRCPSLGQWKPVRGDCSAYLYCDLSYRGASDWSWVEKKCPDGHLANAVTMNCDPIEIVRGSRPECRNATTSGYCDPARPHRPVHGKCMEFEHCVPRLDGVEWVPKICGPGTLFNPVNMICDWPESVALIRDDCEGLGTTVDLPLSTTPVTSPCPPGKTWSGCAYPCQRLCSNFKSFLQQHGFCLAGEECAPGCLPSGHSCKPGEYFVDSDGCVDPRQCPCVSRDGALHHPGALWRNGCEICQCLDNEFVCDRSGCITSTTAKTTTSTWKPSTAVLPVCDQWTPWINRSNPAVSLVESEHMSLSDLRAAGLCTASNARISAIECRNAADKKRFDQTGDVGVTCDLTSGLVCQRKRQPPPKSACSDYEIRYFCSCAESQVLESVTTPLPVLSTPPIIPAAPCPKDYVSLVENLPESAFGASSSLSRYSGPHMGSIFANGQPGGWIPAVSTAEQFLQIDFGAIEGIHGIDVASDSPNGFVKSYAILISDDGSLFHPLIDPSRPGSPLVIQGQTAFDKPTTYYFNPPFETRFLRINPLTWEKRIEMMIDIFGCGTTHRLPTREPSPFDQCPDEMGLSNGQLSDSQVSASSMNPLTNISDIRIGSNRFWQPAISDKRQFIKIDFLSPRNLSGISYVSDPTHFVRDIEVKYSHDGVNWNVAQLRQQSSPTRVRRSTEIAVRHRVDFPALLRARYLMIAPVSWVGGISLQIEVHGCFEPYPEVPTTTTTRRPANRKLDLCFSCPTYRPSPDDGVAKCDCPAGKLWNGRECVQAAECPCFVQHYEYSVGASFYTEKCQECLCKLGGVVECLPKNCSSTHCPEADSQRVLVNDNGKCTCTCRPCPPGKRLCPTSNECINASSWCDGVQDCADDEKGCQPSTTTTPRPTTTTTRARTTTTVPSTTTTRITTTTEPPPMDAYCYSMGRTIRTFDGAFYKYDICENTLLTDGSPKFAVKVRRECSSPTRCWKVVAVDFGNDEIVLHQNFTVDFNGMGYSVPQVQRIARRTQLPLDIFRMGNSVILILSHSSLGTIRLIWNSQQHLRLKVTRDALGKTLGLCGTFDNDVTNEYRTPEGGVALVSQVFADSWSSPDRVCGEVMVCPANLQRQAWDFCQKIREDPFSNCASHLSVDQFLSHCAETACQCLRNAEGSPWKVAGCKCNALVTFAAACLAVAEDDPSEGHSISTWRTVFDCPAQCPRGYVHYDCQPDSCLQTCENAIAQNGFDRGATCANNYTLESENEQSKICFPGCYCPDGLVEKDGACLPPKACHDLSCDVFESGHMLFTFDRARYPLRGNCSYILVQDKPDKTFQIILINQCELGKANCYKGLLVKHKRHEILVLKNETLVDGTYLAPSSRFEDQWVRVENSGGIVASIHLLLEEVEIEFTSSGLQSFNVRLSSHVYRNKLEGLCGNADGVHTNDVPLNAGNAEKFARQSQYTANLPAKLQASVNHSSCSHAPSKNTSLCSDDAKAVASQICSGLFKPEFERCHLVENPQRYVDICERELCQMGAARHEKKVSVACRISQQYAARCSHLGICLDWRSSEFCPLSCADGRQYEACHSSCPDTCPKEEPEQPSTGEVTQQILEVDLRLRKPKYLERDCKLSMRTEGCFCPPGQFFSVKQGKCVEEHKCVPCDDQDHFPGDQWKPDSCTECTCTDDSRIQCSIRDCARPPICERGHELVELEKAPDQCCAQFECRAPKIAEKLCEDPPRPICSFGQILKIVELEGQCPFFSCECLPAKDCPTPEPIPDLLPGEETVEIRDGCCPKLERRCNKRNCPIIFPCPTFYTMGVANGTEHLCCPTHTCDAPKEACIFQHTFRSNNRGSYVKVDEFLWETKLHHVNETWQDGPCSTCECKPSSNTTYAPVCVQESCVSHESLEENYEIELRPVPGECCPAVFKKACKYKGELKAIGSRWPSKSNKCEDLSCRQSTNGEAEIIRVARDCQRTCDLGWEYRTPAQLGPNYDQCCGKCVKVACVDDKGQLRLANTTWASKDGCYNYRCAVNVNGQVETVGGKKDCPYFDSSCKPENVKMTADGCCRICNTSILAQVNCGPRKIQNSLGVLQTADPRSPNAISCRPAAEVDNVKQCLGHCESSFVFSTDPSLNIDSCKCCKPTAVSSVDVTWVCPDGYSFNHTLSSATSCECQACSEDDPDDASSWSVDRVPVE